MAETSFQNTLRILFRAHWGLPIRQASDEDKKKVGELWIGKILQKWKASGVKLIGTFHSNSMVDGYSHHYIFEVDDIIEVQEMNRVIFTSEVGKFIEQYSFTIGTRFRPVEDSFWKKSS